jgi:hypothetical protein
MGLEIWTRRSAFVSRPASTCASSVPVIGDRQEPPSPAGPGGRRAEQWRRSGDALGHTPVYYGPIGIMNAPHMYRPARGSPAPGRIAAALRAAFQRLGDWRERTWGGARWPAWTIGCWPTSAWPAPTSVSRSPAPGAAPLRLALVEVAGTGRRSKGAGSSNYPLISMRQDGAHEHASRPRPSHGSRAGDQRIMAISPRRYSRTVRLPFRSRL